MSRSRARRPALTALGVLVAAIAAVPAAAHAQEAYEPQVRDLVFTVVSLDGSVSTDESVEEVAVTLDADVLFGFDEASLGGKAESRIGEAADRIREGEPSSVLVEGHTDSKGPNAYNQRLSERRAEAVANALRDELGDDAPSLETKGFGEAKPVAPNTKEDGSDNPSGRAQNRRVTVRFDR
jgi:OmpA-OmpF porin, OOP family